MPDSEVNSSNDRRAGRDADSPPRDRIVTVVALALLGVTVSIGPVIALLIR